MTPFVPKDDAGIQTQISRRPNLQKSPSSAQDVSASHLRASGYRAHRENVAHFPSFLEKRARHRVASVRSLCSKFRSCHRRAKAFFASLSSKQKRVPICVVGPPTQFASVRNADASRSRSNCLPVARTIKQCSAIRVLPQWKCTTKALLRPVPC